MITDADVVDGTDRRQIRSVAGNDHFTAGFDSFQCIY